MQASTYIALCFVLFILPPATSLAQVLAPAAELAQKISQKMSPPSAASLEVRNASFLSVEQVAEARRAIERELRRRVRLARGPEASAAAITVTFSENRRGAVWVAEIRRGETRDVVILPVPLLEPQRDKTVSLATIEKTLLWQQDRPILDLVMGEDDLFVLEPGQLTHVWKSGGRWTQSLAVSLSMPQPWPRDLRGRLNPSGDVLRVYLPGFTCNGLFERPVKLECEARSSRWPFPVDAEMVAGRNFFTARDLPPFYSAVRLGSQGREMLAIAAVDGRVHLYSGGGEPSGTVDGWGSDIVEIQTSCASGSQILAAPLEADKDSDSVQAFEIVNRRPVAVSPPVELPGVLTALWPSTDASKALAVVFDSRTQRYAAYSLAVTCGY